MLELDESRKIAYREFLSASNRLMEVMDQNLSDAGLLPLSWYDVLVTLEYAEGHHLRMSELADRVLLSRSGLTRLIDKLEQKGYVERQSCPMDRRGTHAVLTDSGKSAREASWPLYSSLVADLFGSQMSDSDTATITGVMSRVIEAVDRFKRAK